MEIQEETLPFDFGLLPTELAVEILMYVPYDRLQGICSVNKELRNLCQSEYLWKRKTLYDMQPFFSEEYIFRKYNEMRIWLNVYKILDRERENFYALIALFNDKDLEEMHDLAKVEVEEDENNEEEVFYIILTYRAGEDINRISRQTIISEEDFLRVKELLEIGAYPDVILSRDGSTPLSYAAEKGHSHSSLVKLLLEYDADPNSMDDDDYAPLHFAIINDHPDIVKLLLDYGADPNLPMGYAGDTPLETALYERNQNIANILRDYGAR